MHLLHIAVNLVNAIVNVIMFNMAICIMTGCASYFVKLKLVTVLPVIRKTEKTSI